MLDELYEYQAPYPTTMLDTSATGRRRKYMEDFSGSFGGSDRGMPWLEKKPLRGVRVRQRTVLRCVGRMTLEAARCIGTAACSRWARTPEWEVKGDCERGRRMASQDADTLWFVGLAVALAGLLSGRPLGELWGSLRMGPLFLWGQGRTVLSAPMKWRIRGCSASFVLDVLRFSLV
jgi:hypothetical protein